MTSSVHDVVAFLRGVIPRGKNAVKMADVRRRYQGRFHDAGNPDIRDWSLTRPWRITGIIGLQPEGAQHAQP